MQDNLSNLEEEYNKTKEEAIQQNNKLNERLVSLGQFEECYHEASENKKELEQKLTETQSRLERYTFTFGQYLILNCLY